MSKVLQALQKIQSYRKTEPEGGLSSGPDSNNTAPAGPSGERKGIFLSWKVLVVWSFVTIVCIGIAYPLGFVAGRKKGGIIHIYAPDDATRPAENRIARDLASGRIAPPVAPPAEPLLAQPVSLSNADRGPEPDGDVETAMQEGRYTIQVISYFKENQAQHEVTRLEDNGFSAFYVLKGRYYQVCIEKFSDRQLAAQKLGELKGTPFHRLYRDAFVRPI